MEPLAKNDSAVWSITSEEWRERLTTCCLYNGFSGLVILINIIPIFLTFATDLRKNEVNLIVANLSIAELLFGVFFIVGQTFYILWREQYSPEGCRWLGAFHFMFAYVEFMFPPVLALNRYISLYFAHLYEKLYTARNIILSILSLWLLAAIVPIIFGLGGRAGFDDDNGHCCITVRDSTGWTIFYWASIIGPLIGACDGLMIYCDYMIYRKLRQHADQQALPNSNVIRQNREILYFLIADMILPACFYTVYHVCKFAVVNRQSWALKRLFIILYLLHSCLRGLITLTMLRPYRIAFVRVFIHGKLGSDMGDGTTNHCSDAVVPFNSNITNSTSGRQHSNLRY